MIKFSVILTTYNCEQWIRRTIQSVLEQQGNNQQFMTELIIIDDCSTDRTREILSGMGLSFLSNPKNTGGPNVGRNKGLELCTGDYICMMDHDDEWESNKLQSILPYIGQAPVITTGYTTIDHHFNRTTIRSCPAAEKAKYYEKNETFRARLSKSKKGQVAYLGGITFSSDLKHIRFEEQFGLADYDWLLNIFYENKSIEICQSLYTRHVYSQNLSLAETYRQMDMQHSLELLKKYEVEFKKESNLAKKRIYGTHARYHYLNGNMSIARQYFLKSGFSLKHLAFYLTTFYGSAFIKRHFNFFG